MHVGFVRREDVHRDRRERRVTGRLEDDRLAAVVEAEPAPFAPDMRRQETRPPRQCDEFAPKIIARAVRPEPPVVLARKDFLAHKILGALF